MVVVALSALVFWAVSGALIDDAYITMAYARNLALHGHWGLVPDHVMNTATSPLNVLALAAMITMLRDGVIATGAIFVLSAVVLEYGLRRVASAVNLPRWFGLLGTAMCVLNPLIISTAGMEIMPGAALIALLLVCAVERRPVLFGVFAGLLIITRPDLVIVVLVVFALRPRPFAQWYLSAAAAVPIAAAWHMASWYFLGSAVPYTLVIKTEQASWDRWTFGNGIALYFDQFPLATVVAFAPAAVGVVLIVFWRAVRPLVALPVAAFAHFGAYCLLGVPPYHWYYGPSVLLLTVYLAAVLSRWGRPGLVTAGLILMADVAILAGSGLPREFVPVQTNHASTSQYRSAGEDLRRIAGDQPVQLAGEIGALAYYFAEDLSDVFSDPGYFVPTLARYQQDTTGFERKLIELNFRYFDRTQMPDHAALRLVEASSVPPDAVASWPISSPWLSVERHAKFLVLQRIDR